MSEFKRLHYDFRLSDKGVLKSWAIPKFKDLLDEKTNKVLAVEVEAHPIKYSEFEGMIPEGEYGAGKVSIFDSGKYEIIEKNDNEWKFKLKGKNIKGMYTLTRTEDRKWLLIKAKEVESSLEELIYTAKKYINFEPLKNRLDYGIKEASWVDTIKMVLDFVSPFAWIFINNPKLKQAYNLLIEVVNEAVAKTGSYAVYDYIDEVPNYHFNKKVYELVQSSLLSTDKKIEDLTYDEIIQIISNLRKEFIDKQREENYELV